MAACRIDGAAAPRANTPTSDEAPSRDQAAQGFRIAQEVSPDCAADADQKHVATAVARAALLGIEARRVPAGAWLLRHAHGADIGIVHGTEALEAAVRGFESARDDVRALVQRIGGAR